MLLPSSTQGRGLGESLNISNARHAAEKPAESDPGPPGDRTSLAETRKRVGLAAVAAASRRSAASQANRVQDGNPLSALQATAGAPAGVQKRSSGLVQPDGGRRSTSLFDQPSSGQGLVARMRGQVRPSSPLNALGGGDNSNSSASITQSVGRSVLGTDDGPLGGLASLSRANSQRAGLNSTFARIDNSSRLLLSTGRASGAFGLGSTSLSAFDLLG